MSKVDIRMKNSRRVMKAKALLVVLMRSLCNFRCTDISKTLGNITQSRMSKLSSRGFALIGEKEEHRGIIKEFMKSYVS